MKHASPEDTGGRTPQQERLRSASGSVTTSDRLVVFIYHLLRDQLPAGVVAGVARLATEEMKVPCEMTNGFLAQYAAFLANELRQPMAEGSASQQRPEVAQIEVKIAAAGYTLRAEETPGTRVWQRGFAEVAIDTEVRIFGPEIEQEEPEIMTLSAAASACWAPQ